MEKERRVKALAIVVLVIAVLGLTIAFAALSQTLTINGSAKLDASKWGLKFDNLVLASGNEYVEGTATIKTDDNTVIENMNVRLTTPGDKVVYTVDLYTNKFNPLAMVAKDVAAGAVVISAFTAICVGLYVFVPKILELL